MNTTKNGTFPKGNTAARKAASPYDVRIMVRCTAAEKQRWQQSAENYGLPLSEFIRKKLNNL
jgi:hypothetical protein